MPCITAKTSCIDKSLGWIYPASFWRRFVEEDVGNITSMVIMVGTETAETIYSIVSITMRRSSTSRFVGFGIRELYGTCRRECVLRWRESKEFHRREHGRRESYARDSGEDLSR